MANQVPVAVRRERNRVLRELAAAKNLEFRRQMIGRRLSAVTLGQERTALTDNYLKVELAQARPSNQLIEVEIGDLAPEGLREASPLPVLCCVSGSNGLHPPAA
jgi:tRNA A37 methylthiotransferase MiaB